MSDPATAALELVRLLRTDGLAAACVWDFAQNMDMLRTFWYAALAARPDSPDEAERLLFARSGEPTGAFTLGAVARADRGRRGG